ncbi:EcsC family protein [Lysobacter sp. BMK333-48F3]|uniref:EcsC family protein n=1 Tax=Lysobacter sp. BMK333-48F3 TaxID=2867962 RepID=UPI001C8B30EC|nr:EcsC family protein [Lysobacter sp. BMK333-48F3]MBX9400703.1 EcsC family protein [Lysobacter sp. BMK333-48F3]
MRQDHDRLDDTADAADLARAVALLETPSLTARMTALAGAPIEFGLSKLPGFVNRRIQSIVHGALHKAAAAALWTVKDQPNKASSTKSHKFAAGAVGALGGFFGAAGLAAELPVSTVVMMRAVADIARAEGFSLADPEVQAACVEVFAFGGGSDEDDASASGYYAVRTALAEVGRQELAGLASRRGAQHATHAYAKKQATAWMSKLVDVVATRFGVVVGEKTAAQLVPVIGAATAATMNVLFTNHYQDMARGHFIVKRLERKYGAERVARAYQRQRSDPLPLQAPAKPPAALPPPRGDDAVGE